MDQDTTSPSNTQTSMHSRNKILIAILLILIILVGVFLRFYHLGSSGYGNMYYAATVKSMLSSWHNFFYAAFEPGGSVSVDKPPLGFWLQALSAYFLGVNGFSLALPQALAGVLSIPLLFSMIKRPFGPWAGLVAALFLSITPITVVTERNNTIDGTLVLVLLLAIWALLKSIRSGKFRYLLLSMFLISIGFNIKMLQAYMILPAVYLVYLIAAPHRWWKRLLHLAAGTILLVAISLAWIVAFDLTPVSKRPFAGSSTDNSMLELVIGHNGLERLGRIRPLARLQGGTNPEAPGMPPTGNRFINPALPGYTRPVNPGFREPQPPYPQYFQYGQRRGGTYSPQSHYTLQPTLPNQQNRIGPNEVGSAGLLRLFTQPLDDEASWLLILALLSIPLTAFMLTWRRPLDEKATSWMTWTVWLIPMVVYFSLTTGLWHTYYLIMLGPGIAALSGMSVWALAHLFQRNRLAGWLAILILVVTCLVYEMAIINKTLSPSGWLIELAILLALTGLILAACRPVGVRNLAVYFLVLSLTLAPFAWSFASVVNSTTDSNLPHSGPVRNINRPANTQKDTLNVFQNAVLEITLANTAPGSYLLVGLNANQTAPYILATGRPVLTLGGFTGSDNIFSLDELTARFQSGELRYVLSGGGMVDRKVEFSQWVRQNCQVVPLPGVHAAQINPRTNLPQAGQPGGQQDQLFDCG
ncbi:MAG: glycosyltransferase family 39 protein [Anaerolineaceae bacterium]